jgi:alkylhydroperoxidase family enzyme
VLTTLARHRRLFRYWLPFASSLLRATALPRADVELVILRTARNSASWYEWAQHVALARAAGLDAAAIGRVTEGPEADGWTERQGALLRATDELHERRVVTDRTWQLLAAELDDNELVEVCFVVGHYEMVAMALNSLGVDADESALEALDPTAAATAGALRHSLAQRRR